MIFGFFLGGGGIKIDRGICPGKKILVLVNMTIILLLQRIYYVKKEYMIKNVYSNYLSGNNRVSCTPLKSTSNQHYFLDWKKSVKIDRAMLKSCRDVPRIIFMQISAAITEKIIFFNILPIL